MDDHFCDETDMPVDVVRRLLPPSTIIGMSVSSIEEAAIANTAAVDYVGIGPIWWTDSKKLTTDVVGVRGIGAILEMLSPKIMAVGIGA
jgi:thiamine-phosphate diphosphorylase/hydroxyethylthiazole kinase